MAAASDTVKIPIDRADPVSGILTPRDPAAPATRVLIVLAHGAANDMTHPSLATLADGLARHGHDVLRFNFPYKEAGRKSPDPEHRLIETWQRVLEWAGANVHPSAVVAGGKSLGCRMASQAVAAGAISPQGLLFLGFPLHAPGKKQMHRAEHLHQLEIPLLFFQGTRDPFCDLDLFTPVFEGLSAPKHMTVVENADHSFQLPRSDPRTMIDIHQLITDTVLNWLNEAISAPRPRPGRSE